MRPVHVIGLQSVGNPDAMRRSEPADSRQPGEIDLDIDASACAHLDEQPIRRFHMLAPITTGMGVFTDGYDLSSIGVVLPLALASSGVDHISGLQSGRLSVSALLSSRCLWRPVAGLTG